VALKREFPPESGVGSRKRKKGRERGHLQRVSESEDIEEEERVFFYLVEKKGSFCKIQIIATYQFSP
jgi:hypothetical protein